MTKSIPLSNCLLVHCMWTSSSCTFLITGQYNSKEFFKIAKDGFDDTRVVTVDRKRMIWL